MTLFSFCSWPHWVHEAVGVPKFLSKSLSYFLCMALGVGSVSGDFSSTTETIGLDSDGDGQNEVTLTTEGLEIITPVSAPGLQIGANSSSANVALEGSFSITPYRLSDNATLGEYSLVLADSSLGNLILSLPDPSAHEGLQITVKKISLLNEVRISNPSGNIDEYRSNIILKSGYLSGAQLSSSNSMWWVTKSMDVRHLSEWSPLELSPLLWLDASDESTISTIDGLVSQWNDKSGLAHHATQATANQRPLYFKSDGRAGDLPSINNLYIDNRCGLDLPSMNVLRIYIVTAYGQGESTFGVSEYPTLISGPGANGNQRIMGNMATADLIGSNAFASVAYINGATVSSATILPLPLSLLRFSGNVTQTWYLGFNELTGNRSWPGPICEVVFTNGSESLVNQQKLEGYLAWKWGIEEQLAPVHPYRHAPPE